MSLPEVLVKCIKQTLLTTWFTKWKVQTKITLFFMVRQFCTSSRLYSRLKGAVYMVSSEIAIELSFCVCTSLNRVVFCLSWFCLQLDSTQPKWFFTVILRFRTQRFWWAICNSISILFINIFCGFVWFCLWFNYSLIYIVWLTDLSDFLVRKFSEFHYKNVKIFLKLLFFSLINGILTSDMHCVSFQNMRENYSHFDVSITIHNFESLHCHILFFVRIHGQYAFSMIQK